MVPPGGKPELEAVEQLRLGLRIMALRALGDPEAAEEAVQETLVRALEALREGRPRDPEKLGAFVRGIARHVIAENPDAIAEVDVETDAIFTDVDTPEALAALRRGET